MSANMDSEIGAKYNQDKFTKMQLAWPNAIKKAVQLAQITLPKNILDVVARVYNSSKSDKPHNKNKVRSR